LPRGFVGTTPAEKGDGQDGYRGTGVHRPTRFTSPNPGDTRSAQQGKREL
jgi:hypothetical protein